MSLVRFLLERIAEDEEEALAAVEEGRPGRQWQWVCDNDVVVLPGDLEEAQAYQRISLRTVEEFPTESVRPLPGFLIGYAENVVPEAGEHIIRWDPARVLAECQAKRRIVELHENWPVLVTKPLEFESVARPDSDDMAFRVSQGLAWVTEAKYVETFGVEPPTAPMLWAMAEVYSGHPDYDEAAARG